MTHFDLSMGSTPIMVSGIIQGLGIGLIFVPLSTLAFATLAPRHRPEATGVYTLMRSLGSSVGISVMQGALDLQHPGGPFEPRRAHRPQRSGNPRGAAADDELHQPRPDIEALNGEITRQAAMIAYIDDFRG